jgi:hypothetical protein
MPAYNTRIRQASFDDKNLLADAGLVALMTLAAKTGLDQQLAKRLTLDCPNPVIKSLSLIAGMAAGADSIDDMDLLRCGATPELIDVRAPSTLGSFLRSFTYGNVTQLDACNTRLLDQLVSVTPGVIPAHPGLVTIDIDDTIKQTYGHAKQAAGYGYNHKKGLNAQIAAISTKITAPLIACSSLRRGKTPSGKGAWKMAAHTIDWIRSRLGSDPMILVRADSAYYTSKLVSTVIAHHGCYSITVRQNKSVKKAITAIPDNAWTPIKYPRAIWDQELDQWISEAEVAETRYTAFTSKPKKHHVNCRLIVRRVKTINPKDQDELVPGFRYHGFITNTTFTKLEADKTHRHHAIVEQVIAELKGNALAHLPSGRFTANAAWLAFATICFNLMRAVATSSGMVKARWSSVTSRLIRIPARIAHSAGGITMHLPAQWPWAHGFQAVMKASAGPPVMIPC